MLRHGVLDARHCRVSPIAGAVGDASAVLIPAIPKAADAPDVTIEDIYADLCFARRPATTGSGSG